MFADDLVALSGSRRGLRKSLAVIGEWANLNEMRFGIKKCGLMKVGEKAKDFPSIINPIAINDEVVPIVREYEYLGLVVNDGLDVEKLVGNRLNIAKRSLYKLGPFLRSRLIPIELRATVLCGIPTSMLYGAELWGGLPQTSPENPESIGQGMEMDSWCV